MESLYFLIPFSTLLMLVVMGVFAWALHGGQFEELDREGERILEQGDDCLDVDQAQAASEQQKSQSAIEKS